MIISVLLVIIAKIYIWTSISVLKSVQKIDSSKKANAHPVNFLVKSVIILPQHAKLVTLTKI